MSIFGVPFGSLVALPIAAAAFVVLLTIIVFVHEYGHFSVARMLGVRVDVFSLGFGKTIAKWVDKKGTEWRISMLPLGGYVKFFGDANAASQATPEVAQEQHEAHPVTTQFPKPGHEEEIGAGMTAEERAVCFHFKPVWARALIVAAGPFFNFFLAIGIFTALFMALGRGHLDPVVASVSPDSAAMAAGFEPGDRIVAVNGRKISQFEELRDQVLLSGGRELQVTVEREGGEITLAVTPTREEQPDRYGNPTEVWLLGIAASNSTYSFQKFGFFGALKEGVSEVARMLSMTVRFLGNMIVGKEDPRQLGGPIKMAQYAGQSAMSGFDESAYSEPPSFWTMLKVTLIDFISFAAVVSVSIGFLNLLPVPVLDGGHLMYYGYEAVAGKPLGERAQAVGFRVGLALLASLMIFVTWNDINNLIQSIS